MFKTTERLFMTLCAFFQNLLKKSPKTLDSPYVETMREIHYTEVKDWRWKNFTPKEIACKGTGLILIDPYSMDCLQMLRNRLGVPIIINSAYRSESHNKAVGGAPNSQHRLGKAFDIRLTDSVKRDGLKLWARQCGFKGIGDYDNFCHIDTRDTPAYWDDRK